MLKYADLPEAIHDALSLSGELTPEGIAEVLGISVGWVAGMLPRMEARGLVERANEVDGWWAK